MPDTFADIYREPSVPHQCQHVDMEDGRRCRAQAMHNEYMCFRHRDKHIPSVIENEPFEITHLDDRAAIQKALAALAARLACNRMDLNRAGLLVYTLQVASCNLGAPPLATPPLLEAGPPPDLL